MAKVLEFKPKQEIMDEAEIMVEAIDRLHIASLTLANEIVQRGQRGEYLTNAEKQFLAESANYALVIHGAGGKKCT